MVGWRRQDGDGRIEKAGGEGRIEKAEKATGRRRHYGEGR